MREASPTDHYAILITESRGDERTRVIKHDDSFAVFDHAGMIRRSSGAELGIYHDGTRFLSRFEIALERRHPLLLGSSVRRDGTLAVDLANPDLPDASIGHLRKDSVHLFLSSFLWTNAWHARLRVHSFAGEPLALELSLLFGADYADIFEVRGIRRQSRGADLPPAVEAATVVLGYHGLDRVVRRTQLAFTPAPALLTESRASYRLLLDPDRDATIEVCADFAVGEAEPPVLDFDTARARVAAAREARASCASVRTSSAGLDEWIERSASDLQMMITETPHGPYPYAGVPWFSTAVRPRRHHHRIRDAVARSRARARRARVPRRDPGERRRSRERRRAGQDHPRGARRRDGGARRDPVRPLLRIDRRDAAVRHARRCVLAAHRPIARSLEAIWPNVERALAWIDQSRRPRRRRASSSTRAGRRAG